MTKPPQHESTDPGERVWERGWEGHDRHQLERLARLPLSEKLAWLEDAQRLALHLTGSKESPPDGKIDE